MSGKASGRQFNNWDGWKRECRYQNNARQKSATLSEGTFAGGITDSES